MKNIKFKTPTKKFYDWDEAWEYLKDKYGFKDEYVLGKCGKKKVISWITDTRGVTYGEIFSFGSSEAKWVPKVFAPILAAIIDEFGEADPDSVLKDEKIARFVLYF